MEKPPIKKVLVTGSAGTVGNFVVQELLRLGYEVRGVDIRPTPTNEFPQTLPLEKLEAVIGDLTDKEFARNAVKGTDAVIHTAALIDISLGYKELAPLNVMAVRYLYEAAPLGPVKVFVHFSSGSIYHHAGAVLITEETPIRPKSAYEQTKAESEDLLRVLSTDKRIPYVILRPALIYGPRGRFLASGVSALPPIFRYLIGKRVPVFSGGTKTNLVHAEDVAGAAVFIMEHPESWWKEYNVADKTILSAGEIITTNIKAYGLQPASSIRFLSPSLTKPIKPLLDTNLFFRTINAPLEYTWASLVKEYDLKGGLCPRLDREAAPYLFHDVIFSSERLGRLGFQFKHEDYRKAVPDVMKWYIANRWIPDYDEIPPASGWTPRVGFIFKEKMTGTFKSTTTLGAQAPSAQAAGLAFEGNGTEYPMELEVDARAARIERFIFNPVAKIRGSLFIQGLANQVEIEGTLSLPILTKRRIVYEFTFRSKEGKPYRFKGERKIDLRRPVETFTTLHGKVTDEKGKEVASAIVRFNLRKETIPLLRSFGLVY